MKVSGMTSLRYLVEEESRFGLMAPDMTVFGRMENNMVSVVRLMLKAIFTKGSGKTINSMVKALINIQMETPMKEIGSMINSMVQVLKTGLMVQCMAVNMLTV